MDNAVDLFTNKLNNIMSPYCRQNGVVQSRDSLFTSALNSTSHRGRHLNKPWFDKDVKKSYYDYISALKIFNKEKSNANRNQLQEKKRLYKLLERKRRRKYISTEGNMLDQLKRNDPKAFYAKFSKRKSVHCPIPLHTFYEHFKSISANIDTDSDDNANNVDDTNEVVYEELDQLK